MEEAEITRRAGKDEERQGGGGGRGAKQSKAAAASVYSPGFCFADRLMGAGDQAPDSLNPPAGCAAWASINAGALILKLPSAACGGGGGSDSQSAAQVPVTAGRWAPAGQSARCQGCVRRYVAV